jgi:transcriptional regulator with XRE-family HTH domain
LPDDERIGRALRELRRRHGWTLAALARESGVSIRVLRRVSRSEIDAVSIGAIRAAFAPFGARARVLVQWRGGELDRILDEAHAAVVERVIWILQRYGWLTAAEVTYSIYGERGSIDILAFHPSSRCGLVVEVKASWGSLDQTNRSLDAKVRLAPKFVVDRFGAQPASVSRLLVMPDDRTLRRVADRHARTLAVVYPVRSRAVRSWLRRPADPISGLWFLTNRADFAHE